MEENLYDEFGEKCQLESMNISLEEVNTQKKKSRLKFLLLLTTCLIIICIVVILIVVFSTKKGEKEKKCEPGYFIPSNDPKKECHKCSLDNCVECHGNTTYDICTSCNSSFYPSYKNNIIEICEYCLRVEEGKCVANFSIKAKYFTEKKMKHYI